MGSSNAAAGLILLGLGVMLLLLYVTGQLEWLFGLVQTVTAAHAAAPTAALPPPAAPPVLTTAAIGPRPRSPSLRAVA